MTDLAGVNGHANTPMGGFPPSSVPQAAVTSVPSTPTHLGTGQPHPHPHRPVDLSQTHRDYLHDHAQRATLLDTGQFFYIFKNHYL